jgi:hypothetical protein
MADHDNEPEKVLHINSRFEAYVVVDLDTGTILSNTRQVVLLAADLIEGLESDSSIIREAWKHGYQLSEVDWSE